MTESGYGGFTHTLTPNHCARKVDNHTVILEFYLNMFYVLFNFFLNPNMLSASYRVLVHIYHVYSLRIEHDISSKWRTPKSCFLEKK